MEFSRALGRGMSIVEMRQELRAFTVAFWMEVAGNELDPGTPISYAVQDGGIIFCRNSINKAISETRVDLGMDKSRKDYF